MARIQDTDDGTPGRRGKAMRYAVPVAAAGIAAATIGLLPALASASTPDLPKISAQKLIEKIAASNTQTISGSVKITTDFGLPSFANLDTSAFGDLTGGKSGGSGSSGGSSGSGAADPKKQLTQLLTGSHILQVAADGPDRQKVSIVEQAAGYSVIHNGTQLWAYDSDSNQAYHAILPKSAADRPAPAPSLSSLTPQEAAEQALKAVDDMTSVTVDGTAQVAGRAAYQLLIKPKAADTTVGAIRIAVDSDTGVPLKFTLTPKGSTKAAVDIGFTKVDFAKPSASTFTFTPPKGTKVTTAKPDRKNSEGALSGLDVVGLGKGWDSIAELKLPAGDSGDKSLLSTFGKKVNGDFGSGTFVSTRVVNALITDSGKVYMGAVSQDALIKAAGK